MRLTLRANPTHTAAAPTRQTARDTSTSSSLRDRLKSPAVLWSVQGLLALVFLFTGAMKLFASDATLTENSPFPALFLRFIGAAEILGALALILPGVLRIRPGLMPLAAAGLVIIMIGAVVTELAMARGALALFPLVLGILAAFVAWGRTPESVWRRAPSFSTRQPAS